MRNWQNMPTSNNIQDRTYGPQPPVAPLAPGQPPFTPPTIMQQLMSGAPRAPLTAAQNRFLSSYLPAQLPTNPIAGSMASGLMFPRTGNTPMVQTAPGATTYTSIQPDPAGQHRIAEDAQTPPPWSGQLAGYSMPPPTPLPPAPGRPGPAFIPGPLSNQWNGY